MTDTVERMLPLYEAKMIHQFDHRWATYEPDGTVREVTSEEKSDPAFCAIPRYWVREDLVKGQLGASEDSLFGFRDVTNATNERTVIAARLPYAAVGNNLPLILAPLQHQRRLLALFCSYVVDYVARLKISWVHMNFFIVKQLAIPSPALFATVAPWDSELSLGDWIDNLVSVLDSMEEAAVGEKAERTSSAVFGRNDAAIELNAGLFVLFSTNAEDVSYIMDTFTTLKRRELLAYGSFRTKDLILEVYDGMQTAIETGQPYVSRFDDLVRSTRGHDS
jgi:hypothetical protein